MHWLLDALEAVIGKLNPKQVWDWFWRDWTWKDLWGVRKPGTLVLLVAVSIGFYLSRLLTPDLTDPNQYWRISNGQLRRRTSSLADAMLYEVRWRQAQELSQRRKDLDQQEQNAE